MVGEVNKIILNTLISRGGIWLPDVGSLQLKRYPATMQGKHILTPPHISVDFSSQRTASSLVDVIAEVASIDVVAAEDIYRRWLNKCHSGVELTIEGVGVLKNKSFIPCEEFISALNSIYGSSIKLRRGVHRVRTAVIIAAVIAIIIGVGFVVLPTDKLNESRVETPMHVVENIPAPEVVESVAAEEVDEDVEADDIFVEEIEHVTDTEVKDEYRHYVVYGSYSTMDNAQRAISALASSTDTSECEIIELGRLYAVVLYANSEKSECERFIRDNKSQFPDAWVHSPRRR